jgi:hypothetical protein
MSKLLIINFDIVFFSEKTELFLELYGNLLVRQQSVEYVQKMSNEFIKYAYIDKYYIWCGFHTISLANQSRDTNPILS